MILSEIIILKNLSTIIFESKINCKWSKNSKKKKQKKIKILKRHNKGFKM